ncbi:cupin domain-containing protein [Algoriphagus halophilus]|uniref:hypothetical protein n=1 Tax=Algoriphagus halophilus TaxID=226505 RepID=UPI001F241349|nr:hypothetical protein [Algoriphagus halophilus]
MSFFVTLKIEFRDRSITLGEGGMLIIPRGVEHYPIADEEVYLLLFEPQNTKNTGNVMTERIVIRKVLIL